MLTQETFKRRLRGAWLRVHCPLGVVSWLAAVLHARTKSGLILPVHYSSYFIVVLITLLTLSGVGLRYVNREGRLRGWWLLLHGPAKGVLGITLLHHVLMKMAVI